MLQGWTGKTIEDVSIGLAAVICIVVTAATTSCFPYYGHIQGKRVTGDAVHLVDARSGRDVPEALVIPRYFSGLAAGVVPEGRPGFGGAASIYLARPFIYEEGSRFELYQPKSLAFFVLPAFVGRIADLDGATFFAAGYRPEWVQSSFTSPKKLLLHPVPIDVAVRDLRHLSALVEQGAITGLDRDWWQREESYARVPETVAFEICFSRTEQRRVQEYLASAIAKLTADSGT
jgi:hypothetical protein